MQNNRKIDICLAPSMMNLFDLSNKQIVIIDVFRATSAMCVFLNNGGLEVIPVSTVEEAEAYKAKNISAKKLKYLVAAERNGKVVSGFDLGNSPLMYTRKEFNGLSLVITTTNGTNAIEKSKNHYGNMILASFLNATAVINYINNLENNDVLIVCSGWKGRFCVEDLLLAGLISSNLISNYKFHSDSDSVLLANNMYQISKKNMFDFLVQSSYMQRMKLNQDVKYCLQKDIMDIVPVWSCSNHEKKGYGSFTI
ncbi:MAG: 2-phosphosulfolactate phosphatase [Flavobacteriales bacterium]|nr:2-phosphosulfolactate phosphatase [Flavobacteriales bacterium]|tara:strand:- start:29290 stop:30048 length:759 start_codon:yes stop_codon:yes gene_type:complete